MQQEKKNTSELFLLLIYISWYYTVYRCHYQVTLVKKKKKNLTAGHKMV